MGTGKRTDVGLTQWRTSRTACIEAAAEVKHDAHHGSETGGDTSTDMYLLAKDTKPVLIAYNHILNQLSL
jgi:hypothetical protein